MDDHSHAMTEVSLALAMAFFSMMILAMVSMAVPRNVVDSQSSQTRPVKPPLLNVLADKSTEQSPVGDDTPLVIYYSGHYYSQDLKIVNPNRYKGISNLLLAVSPALTLDQVVGAKAPISGANVSITMLDGRWMARLEGKK